MKNRKTETELAANDANYANGASTIIYCAVRVIRVIRGSSPDSKIQSAFVHAKAAVNTKLGARDVTGAVGCEKDDTVRNFFHCSPAPGNDTPIAARFAQKVGLRFALLPGKVVRP